MRDNADVWPQALWATGRPPEPGTIQRPPGWPPRVLVCLALVMSLIGAVLFLALVVAPSAGAAGGCGGG